MEIDITKRKKNDTLRKILITFHTISVSIVMITVFHIALKNAVDFLIFEIR